LLNIAAGIVDHPLSRITLGFFGAVVTALVGLFSASLLMFNPIQDPAIFATGLGACLGLIGWWVRLLVRSPALTRLPRLKATLSVCLLAGIGAASRALLVTPVVTPAFPLLAAMVGAGMLLLLGTLAPSEPGPSHRCVRAADA
jgi:hypothetical protein